MGGTGLLCSLPVWKDGVEGKAQENPPSRTCLWASVDTLGHSFSVPVTAVVNNGSFNIAGSAAIRHAR